MTPDRPLAPLQLNLNGAEQGLVDAAAFREAMALMGATVCVVTGGRDEARLGRTVTAALSLSAEPPAVLVSLNTESALAQAVRESGRFSFAMLSEGQQAVADAFAGKVEAARRFESGTWDAWPSGEPKLQGAVAAMDCRVLTAVETGTHILLIGGVTRVETNPACSPLIWHGRSYKAPGPLAG
ncbi:flavin reductase family protein [Pseudoroseicyclus aestuarii]|uniref:Flavin reductase (DIM6/NTAB) family NADH-FMN oxidoreductase RutF n=1 Tax=Pseudoroseicyclus aestuarii TaxID=1795041 RepID=A0A318SRB6_9RHOB|nr:flavin reductase family protein [Pseudoroseicyclus aestuarii]PYE84213.1 flavin reductase (DIM6/NTAB) family NADH-FMN oxidoreductase RutF [Pseudoroseicyclus aestuarii]